MRSRDVFLVLLTTLSSKLEIKTLDWPQHCVKSVQIWSFFWSVFSRIRAEYRDLRSKSQYSVLTRKNVDQKKLCIWTLFTQCQDVVLTPFLMFSWIFQKKLKCCLLCFNNICFVFVLLHLTLTGFWLNYNHLARSQ